MDPSFLTYLASTKKKKKLAVHSISIKAMTDQNVKLK